MFPSRHYFALPLLLSLLLTASAQDALVEEDFWEVDALEAEINTAAEEGPMTQPDIAPALLWRLLGGGEVVGNLVKETPQAVYVDIGPTIIQLPRATISERVDLAALAAMAEAGPAQADAAARLAGGHRLASGRILSQQEVLEEVKRGVVLVSNPGGLGTGWLLDSEGRVLTNQHVVGIEAFQTVTIFVQNGDQWERRRIENCTVEAFSTLMDLAIVRLDMEQVNAQGIELHPLRRAAVGSLAAGDSVFAVGNPGMGRMVLDHTISEGIVSSLTRNIGDILFVQTTAAVNPGNSGGPLVNQRGEVVGVVTLRALFQEGVAFALPINYAEHFIRHSSAFAVNEAHRNRGVRYHRPQ